MLYSSSLQRIESSNTALTNDVRAIKNYIASNQGVVESKVPVLSALDDDLMSTTLSASLMINAEASQPWSTIRVDRWIGAAKWWLLRSQLELRSIIAPEQSVSPAAYADLIKAGWILVDVIPCHPQFPFISASTSSELRSLSAEVKNEFSKITALAMVVPALSELSSLDLRLWESIPLKSPILRPYKVSQNLDAWTVDGGEHVLFRGFAFYESDSGTRSPCILLFLVHESAKAARLVAQDQNGDIVKAISLSGLLSPRNNLIRLVDRKEKDTVAFGKENLLLNHVQEAQVLWNMAEATSFYMSGRRLDHASLEDLKAYMLLTAVKNREEQAALQIRQEICKMNDIVECDQKGSLAQLAVSMTSQWIKGRLFQDARSDWRYQLCWRPESSLFSWAVACNHTTLIEFLVSEDPVIDEKSEFWRFDPWEFSVTYGNEALMRWCVKRDGRRDEDVTKYLYRAVTRGNANIVALLIDAGANIDDSVIYNLLLSPPSELVVHAILAMAYATNPASKPSLRKAADRGHEGALVLLSYVSAIERAHLLGYKRHSTQDSGHFEQVVAILAKAPNILPAFGLTLLTVERRRTQVLLKVVDIPPWLDTKVYLDSYHAYVENVPEGVSEAHKKVIKIETNGEFQITVVHQEKDLALRLGRTSEDPDRGGVSGRTSTIVFDTDGVSRAELLVERFPW